MVRQCNNRRVGLILLFMFISSMSLGAISSECLSSDGGVEEVIQQLPSCSELRNSLEQGNRGSGIEQPYMEEMRREGVKRVFVEVFSTWQQGHVVNLKITHRLFFTKFDGPDAEVTDAAKIDEFKQRGLTAVLDKSATERVAQAHYFPGREGPKLRNGIKLWSYVEFMSNPLLPEQRTLISPLGKLDQFVHAAYIGDSSEVRQTLSRQTLSHKRITGALFQAVLNRYDNSDVIKLLVNSGADVNFHGHDGITPLMNAVPHPCNLKALLDLGARVQETDRWGKTALQLAREEKQTESIRLLLAHSSQNN